MITPRTTSLVRAANLRLFRRALVRLARQGSPLDARDRLVVVPTTAARLHLTRTIERSAPGATVVLPEIVTRADLHDRLFARLAAVDVPPVYRGVEVEASVVDGPASRVVAQGHNRLHASRGLLAFLMGVRR